jgi:hypothetical protein
MAYQLGNKMKIPSAICLSAVLLIASIIQSSAFALLGPVQPWMQAANGVIFNGDIGGPMGISNGYRWNVPVITYGFDQSFLNYFGSNGVTAVESAIQLLNDLPPASQLVLTNYPFETRKNNFAAQAQSLSDLKSQSLSLILEHLGLAQPTRNIYVLDGWNSIFFSTTALSGNITISGMPLSYESDPNGMDLGAFNGSVGYVAYFVAGFNFDPQTFDPSIFVNGTSYFGGLAISDTGQKLIVPYPINPLNVSDNAVADYEGSTPIGDGVYFSGLTYDDVGGLAFLLSTNNINYETLLSGVAGVGTNANSFVNGAWRPGVDKITFMLQPVDSQSGAFLPATNCFTDSYITNGFVKQQQLARIILKPDFIFNAGDVSAGIQEFPLFSRTGTSNWLNNATANGNINGAGPGVILPPVRIVFNKLGRLLFSGSNITEDQAVDYSQFWGSYNGSTNAPIVYPPLQTGTNQLTVRMWLEAANPKSVVWRQNSLFGTQFAMQTSTNLMNWITLFTVTNNGSVSAYFNENPTSECRFYRLIPQ